MFDPKIFFDVTYNDRYNSSIFCLINTKTDLYKNLEKVKKLILDFIESINKLCPDKQLVFDVYETQLKSKVLLVTKKNIGKIFGELDKQNCVQLTVGERYIENKDENYSIFTQEIRPVLKTNLFSLEISFNTNNPISVTEMSTHSDSILMEINERLFDKYKSKEYIQSYFVKYLKNLRKDYTALYGFISYATYGGGYTIDRTRFERKRVHNGMSINHKYAEYVRGYYWGQILTKKHIEKLGGIENLKKSIPNYIIEVLDDDESVYVQANDNIFTCEVKDLIPLREISIPLFPEKEGRIEPSSIEGIEKSRAKGVNYMLLDEDL